MKNSVLPRIPGIALFFALAVSISCSDSGDPVEPPAPCTSCVVSMRADIDNTMYEDVSATNSNGIGEWVFSGTTTGTGSGSAVDRRALVRFDVAAHVPPGAVIDSVALFLTLTAQPTSGNGGVGSAGVWVHRVTRQWGEGSSNATARPGAGTTPTTNDATWVHALFPGSLWTNPGGDFVSAPSGSTMVDGVGTRHSWGSAQLMRDDVQGWLDDPSNNFGWVLIGDESQSGTVKEFGSQQNSNTQRRPSLQVFYTAP